MPHAASFVPSLLDAIARQLRVATDVLVVTQLAPELIELWIIPVLPLELFVTTASFVPSLLSAIERKSDEPDMPVRLFDCQEVPVSEEIMIALPPTAASIVPSLLEATEK